jgi:hypothetical protein
MSSASKKVVQSTEWFSVALVAVSAVAVLALAVGIVALSRSNHAAVK